MSRKLCNIEKIILISSINIIHKFVKILLGALIWQFDSLFRIWIKIETKFGTKATIIFVSLLILIESFFFLYSFLLKNDFIGESKKIVMLATMIVQIVFFRGKMDIIYIF